MLGVLLVLYEVMSHKVIDFWNDNLLKHSDKSHGIYKATELYKVPESPGIYSWHIGSSPVNFNHYFKAFKQKKLSVSINGHLKEEYDGEIRRKYFDKDFDISLDQQLCELASTIFCPPLYIGISKNLNKRLNQHFRELEKIYNGTIKLSTPPNVGKTDFDTIIESSHFAQRIGHTLFNLNKISLRDIFIKTVELDKSYSWTKLQKVEKYLNRTFIPIYGRK